MISIRSIARAAPRAASRLTASAVRRPAAAWAPKASSSSLLWQPAAASRFSTSAFRFQKQTSVDEELVAKLESELDIENSVAEDQDVRAGIREFLDNGPWELVDVPGQEEVVLTRKFGAETVRVSFSIADLNVDPENDYEDSAMGDEEDVDAQGSGKDVDGRDDMAAEGEEGEMEDQGFPARVHVIIEKPGSGALAVETVAADGQIVIENVYYYKDASFAHAKTADVAHVRQELYVGPPFGNLDEDLQIILERYLDERGVNAALAEFVPDYIDMKEQKEYVQWLSSVKSFVAA